MPGLLFNNVWMLAGLAALSIPVLVHLLLKRKKKKLRFSTVQFFAKQDEQSSQRRKLRNWLLLALRLLICALLVLAFARPFLPNRGLGTAGQRKRVLLVLDRSLSMQANATDGPQWVRAREAARQILSDLGPDDRAALIGCETRAEVLSEWAPPLRVAKVLADLQPTCEPANLSEGLQQARKLLSVGDPNGAAIVYVISDLQRSSCQNLASAPMPRETEIKLVKVGDLAIPNLAVADLQLESSEGGKPHVLVVSFSDEECRGVNLDLRVDGVAVAAKSFDLSPGTSTNLELDLPPFKPGWHEISAQLRKHDALALDDTRWQCLWRPEPARVLVAEDRPSTRTFEEESFFVRAALQPAEAATATVESRFECEKVSPDVLATRLTARQKEKPCDWVVLPGLKHIPSALGAALASYIRAGGGLLIYGGDGISANHYNTEFREFLPAQLGDVEISPPTKLGWSLGQYDTNGVLFSAFQRPNSGNLSLARFTKRLAVDPAQGSTVAAMFEDAKPAVVVRDFGQGRVVFVNSSADTSWNDWPKHKTFVPWLHSTGHYLANVTSRHQLGAQVDGLAGMERDVDLGLSAANAEFKLQSPEGKERIVMADSRGQLRDLLLPSPGVYLLRDRTNGEARRLVANVAVQESDLAALSAADVQQLIARLVEPKTTALTAGLFGETHNQREFWRILLMGVVLLLFVELLVANRTLA